jgi:hypothetical protein
MTSFGLSLAQFEAEPTIFEKIRPKNDPSELVFTFPFMKHSVD